MASYFTVNVPAEGIYKEKGSKFLSFLFPIKDEEDFKLQLDQIKKANIKARHFCFAFRFGFEDNRIERSNDDGEPSGTAGKPILGQLERHSIEQAGLVVVRYFGGTKLGVSGLIKAYKSAAENAIQNSNIVTSILTSKCRIGFSYEAMGVIMKVLKDLNIKIVETAFENEPSLLIEVESSKLSASIISIKARLLNRAESDVHMETEIEGIRFSINDV